MSFQTDNLYIRSGSITYNSAPTGAFLFNSSIVPASTNLTLGSYDSSWSNFYVSNLNMGTGGINMGTGSIIYNYTAPTGSFIFNSSLVPSNANLSLGTLEEPWKSLYVSTGTVFIGPTGTLLINDNGLISSTEGFAAPYFQVGSINPGNGLLLFEQNNLLYFTNASGATGAVSVFSISPGTTVNTYYSLPGNVGFGVTGPTQKIDVLGNIKASDTVYSASFSGTNLHISSIESINNVLNIATNDNNTNTINLGTSNSIQTVNIGTVGTGVTTINLGGVGDTVNVAGTLVYVNSTVTEITNPRFIINEGGTAINNTGITVSQNSGPTGAYILVNSASNAWTLKAGSGSLVTLNQDVSSGANVSFGTVDMHNFSAMSGSVTNLTVTNFTGTNVSSNTVTTNTLNFDGTGSIYFQTGTSTGCFISGLNYNVTDSLHYVYYSNTSKELTQTSPMYFYSYSTTTQGISTASNAVTAFFQPVTFDVNALMYHTFQHSTGSSVFTGSFQCPATLQFSYSILIHSTSNSKETAAAVLYLDGSPIAGSYRSATVIDTTGEYALANTFLVSIPSGNHTIQLQVAATNTNVSIGGTPNIAPPSSSYTSANLCCTRVI